MRLMSSVVKILNKFLAIALVMIFCEKILISMFCIILARLYCMVICFILWF